MAFISLKDFLSIWHFKLIGLIGPRAVSERVKGEVGQSPAGGKPSLVVAKPLSSTKDDSNISSAEEVYILPLTLPREMCSPAQITSQETVEGICSTVTCFMPLPLGLWFQRPSQPL
jgi:hypothetical protein